MNQKDKIASQAVLTYGALIFGAGVYGAISGHFLLVKYQKYIDSQEAQLLSLVVMALALSIALPEAIKLAGVNLERSNKIIKTAQYIIGLIFFFSVIYASVK